MVGRRLLRLVCSSLQNGLPAGQPGQRPVHPSRRAGGSRSDVYGSHAPDVRAEGRQYGGGVHLCCCILHGHRYARPSLLPCTPQTNPFTFTNGRGKGKDIDNCDLLIHTHNCACHILQSQRCSCPAAIQDWYIVPPSKPPHPTHRPICTPVLNVLQGHGCACPTLSFVTIPFLSLSPPPFLCPLTHFHAPRQVKQCIRP